MVDRVMFHAAQRRGAAGFSAACFLATLMLVAAAPFVSAQTNGCGGDNGGITLSPGFCATIFADNLGHARQMAFGPNGVLYLNTWSGGYYQDDKPPAGGFLVALKDTKGDGRADVMARFGDGVAQGSAGGTGIRIYNGGLFAEQNDKIIRYPLPANGFVPGEQPHDIVSGLPLTGDHPMHPFIIDAEGHLFVDLGSGKKIVSPIRGATSLASSYRPVPAPGSMMRTKRISASRRGNATPPGCVTAKDSRLIPAGGCSSLCTAATSSRRIGRVSSPPIRTRSSQPRKLCNWKKAPITVGRNAITMAFKISWC
jgi:glucose/arabinose dehydrogenase